MKFRVFIYKIQDLNFFNLNDVQKLDPDFRRQQLTDWLERGYIKVNAGGYYALEEMANDVAPFLFNENEKNV